MASVANAEADRSRQGAWLVVLALVVTPLLGCSYPALRIHQPATAAAGHDDAKFSGAIGSNDVPLGRRRFEQFCADCHPAGGKGYGPSLLHEAYSPAVVRRTVREGGRKMRPISTRGLSDYDLEAVLAWLASVNAEIAKADQVAQAVVPKR